MDFPEISNTVCEDEFWGLCVQRCTDTKSNKIVLQDGGWKLLSANYDFVAGDFSRKIHI